MPVIQTVLGNIEPNLLGRTLTHEHIALDFEHFYCSPPEDFQSFLDQKLCLTNLGFIRQYPYSSLDNLRLNDDITYEAVIKDLELYKRFGGSSIVENTSHGLNRNLEFMVEASKKTGVNIIAGTGHYVHELQNSEHMKMSVEQMTDLYSKEIITGIEIDGIGMIKCGFIGEVGSVYPLHDFEKRAIKATGEIQEVLGCGVSFHPGRNADAPFEILRLYLEAGGKANKCVVSHMDRTILDFDQLLEFAKFGCYIQYDLFGTECSYYQLNPTKDMPNDAHRINYFMKLIDEGLINRLLMSHDVHTKHRLTSFGGHGYHHVHMNILPRMFAKGLTLDQAEQITVINPTNWLEFNI
uniref:Phosphotriesterase-related protein n=1 Tax=Glossina brevipalpis TaxID=37001 RepID=A0A1A9WQ53_9MUSC